MATLDVLFGESESYNNNKNKNNAEKEEGKLELVLKEVFILKVKRGELRKGI